MQKLVAFLLSVFTGLLAVTGFCAQLQAQQTPQANGLTLHVQVNEVILPATVRDKKGALVNSLKISDFTLTEDGRPQTIKSFSQQSNLPFMVGLLVDTSRSMDSARNDVRTAAGKFVDQMIPAALPLQEREVHLLIRPSSCTLIAKWSCWLTSQASRAIFTRANR